MKYIIMSLLILIKVSCSEKTEEINVEKAIPVNTIIVEHEELSIPVKFSGILQTESEMKLSFKIGGILQSLNVAEGLPVKKNQLLATLDLTEINAGLAQAKAAYQKAQRDFERIENLYADTVATLEQLQNIKTALDVAKANLKIAEFNHRHAKILAPADGEILKKFGEANELIGPGTPVYIFSGKQQSWIIKGGMADQDRIKVSAGDRAEIKFDLYPNKTFAGEVLSVSGILDPRSATYSAEIVLKDIPNNVLSGLIGNVTIYPKAKQKACLLPVTALSEAHGMNAFVFEINNENRAQKIAVKIAAILNDQVLVQSGLEDGMRIATEGSAYLMDGSLVQSKQ